MTGKELAEKLKDAGLVWEPKLGDWYFYPKDDFTGLFFYNECFGTVSRRCWLPRLGQLLAEIEARGCVWELKNSTYPHRGKYSCSLYSDRAYGDTFFADTPEDAAALALLWIMERGPTE